MASNPRTHLPLVPGNYEYQIFVKYDTGTYTLDVHAQDTLGKLKDQIKQSLGFEEWGRRRLTYNKWWDRHNDYATLAECEITRDQTLSIQWRLPLSEPHDCRSCHDEREGGNDDKEGNRVIESLEELEESKEAKEKKKTLKRKRDDERQDTTRMAGELGKLEGDAGTEWPSNSEPGAKMKALFRDDAQEKTTDTEPKVENTKIGDHEVENPESMAPGAEKLIVAPKEEKTKQWLWKTQWLVERSDFVGVVQHASGSR